MDQKWKIDFIRLLCCWFEQSRKEQDCWKYRLWRHLSWTALVLNTESINVSINTAWGVIILNYDLSDFITALIVRTIAYQKQNERIYAIILNKRSGDLHCNLHLVWSSDLTAWSSWSNLHKHLVPFAFIHYCRPYLSNWFYTYFQGKDT